MNYIKTYEILIPESTIEILEDQKKRFESDMRDGKHPEQVKIHEMICNELIARNSQ